MMAECDEAVDIAINSSSTLPRSAKRCRIPRLNRSTSVKLRSERPDSVSSRPKSMTMPRNKDYPWYGEMNKSFCDSVASMPFSVDDNSSICSFASYNSFQSPGGGTEASSSSRPISRTYYGKKYVLHCDRHLVRQEEYLTPTQRKDREIRQLKTTIRKQAKSLEEKDTEIERLNEDVRKLTDTIEELKLTKHRNMNSSQESDSAIAKISLISSSDESSSDQNEELQALMAINNDDSGISNSMSISFSPRHSSELFEELEHQRMTKLSTVDKAVCTTDSRRNSVADNPRLSLEFDAFLNTYKHELEQMKHQHNEHYEDLKGRFNDRVDDLLQKMTEANSRYLELRPLFEKAQNKIENIETQLTEVQRDIESQEDYHNRMYLKMYRKGQEAARPSEEALDFTQQVPRQVSVQDLLHQLHQLELELEQTKQLYKEALRGVGDRQAEYTLRFLKDAVFYFLTKKEKEHLRAIQSILGFTDAERLAVAKAMKSRRLFCSPFKLKK